PIYDSNNKMLKHSGDIHFNNDVKDWSLLVNNGTSLYLTALHEIGHSLGLNHVMDEKSIMFPYYISRTDTFKLIDTIIDGVIIREKYSKISVTYNPITEIPTTEIPTTYNPVTGIPNPNNHNPVYPGFECLEFINWCSDHPAVLDFTNIYSLDGK